MPVNIRHEYEDAGTGKVKAVSEQEKEAGEKRTASSSAENESTQKVSAASEEGPRTATSDFPSAEEREAGAKAVEEAENKAVASSSRKSKK